MHTIVFKDRTIVTLSTDCDEEEAREAISKATGIPSALIDLSNLGQEKARIRGELEKVNEIIFQYKAKLESDPKTTKDKYDELYDVGKFVYTANNDYPSNAIFEIEVPETKQLHPDFVLSFAEKKIGIEHCRLMDNKAKQTYEEAQRRIDKAEEIINSELGYLSKTINIYIDYDKNVIGGKSFRNGKFSKEQRIEVSQVIADYIRSRLIGGNKSKPAFIRQVEITQNKDARVDLELSEKYLTENKFAEALLHRIAEKERKAQNYRSSTDVDLLWLLIVVNDLKSFAGFNLESGQVPRIESSNFDCILIFEKFSRQIHIVYWRNA